MDQPTTHSTRVLLRPFSLDAAPAVQLLAGDHEIADTTLSIPHPYEDGMAEDWISGHDEQFQPGTNAIFAILEKERLQLICAISLTVNKDMQKAGMVHEGTLREDMIKWGQFEDLRVYGLLKDDWSDRSN